jgi:hypothetical protein
MLLLVAVAGLLTDELTELLSHLIYNKSITYLMFGYLTFTSFTLDVQLYFSL